MWFIHNYVFLQLAHHYADEMLLWGAMSMPGADDDATLDLIDDIAEQLIAVESGAVPVEALLRKRYDDDEQLHPGPSVTQYSPYGDPPRTVPIGCAARCDPAN